MPPLYTLTNRSALCVPGPAQGLTHKIRMNNLCKIIYLGHFFFAFPSFLAGAGASGATAAPFPFSFPPPFLAFFSSAGALSGAGAAADAFFGIFKLFFWSKRIKVFLLLQDASHWSGCCQLSNVSSFLAVLKNRYDRVTDVVTGRQKANKILTHRRMH